MNKKIIEYILRALLYSCSLLGWWGFLYPQLAMTPDTVTVVEADGTGKDSVQTDRNVLEWDFDSDIYWKILQAEPNQIRLKSGLFRFFNKGKDM